MKFLTLKIQIKVFFFAKKIQNVYNFEQYTTYITRKFNTFMSVIHIRV